MRRLFLLALFVLASACGTQSVKLAPVTVEPIHMTIDVNLHDAPSK